MSDSTVPPSRDVAAAEAEIGPPFRFAPRLVDDPDGHLAVEVDIPDGPDGRPTDEDVFAAMDEAIRLVFPGAFDGGGS